MPVEGNDVIYLSVRFHAATLGGKDASVVWKCYLVLLRTHTVLCVCQQTIKVIVGPITCWQTGACINFV